MTAPTRPAHGADAWQPGSAERLLVGRQRLTLALLAAGLCAATVLAPVLVVRSLIALLVGLYVVTLAHRTWLFALGARRPGLHVVSDQDARAAVDLPVYTVLVPAYGEPEVIGGLLDALERLEYPRHLLDVRLLLERDDHPTRSATRVAVARHPGLAGSVTVVVVPPVGPQTKPKACNVGLQGARGALVTIYDAEDRPESLQLRRAAVALARAPREVVCLQARLTYHNVHQNLITRWFTSEYDVWFRYFLPGLVASGAPVPLGGTSNHVRRDALDAVGGWDAHNVTEDADLGLRLHRAGWRTGVLDSDTEEEANSDFVNWVRQRSRWYKGYLTTWLVHLRSPRQLVRQLGWRGALGFCSFVGGTPLLAAVNPVFWTLSLVWLVFGAGAVEGLFVPAVYHLSLACWVLGGSLVLYTSLYAAREQDREDLLPALLLLPLYWVMMSVAALKAVWQLVARSAYWEKTVHGLDGSAP